MGFRDHKVYSKAEHARVDAINAANAYAELVRASSAPCVHGHLSCAAYHGGKCLDELFSSLGLDNDGNPI